MIFGALNAPLIADAIRDGLVHGGCPPHLAHWSAPFGVQEAGIGLIGQVAIPDMSPACARPGSTEPRSSEP